MNINLFIYYSFTSYPGQLPSKHFLMINLFVKLFFVSNVLVGGTVYENIVPFLHSTKKFVF